MVFYAISWLIQTCSSSCCFHSGCPPLLILLPTPISLRFAFKQFDSVTPHCHFLSWVPGMFLDFSLWVNWSLSILLTLANGISDQNHAWTCESPFLSSQLTKQPSVPIDSASRSATEFILTTLAAPLLSSIRITTALSWQVFPYLHPLAFCNQSDL